MLRALLATPRPLLSTARPAMRARILPPAFVRHASKRGRKPAAAAAAATATAAEPSANRNAALTMALKQIESTFGKGAIMRLGDRPVLSVPTIPTGSLGLDVALGVGGLPKGRVVEIYGPESCGKTTLALHVVAESQKRGGTCAFIDAEHALDPIYARKLGVNIDELLLAQPDSGENALEIADTLVRSGAMEVVVVDSVAALVPRAEAEGEMGDHHMALQARLMSQALRKLTSSLSKSETLIIFINQIRSKVGVMFGSPEVTAGGNALKYYASVRLDIRRKTPIKKGEEVVGYETKVKVVKNKLAPPFREVTFDLMFSKGISKFGELVDLAVSYGLVKKSGAWFSFTEEMDDALQSLADTDIKSGANFAQGKDKAKLFFEMYPQVTEALESRIREKLKQGQVEAQPVEGEGDNSEGVEGVEEEEEEEAA